MIYVSVKYVCHTAYFWRPEEVSWFSPSVMGSGELTLVIRHFYSVKFLIFIKINILIKFN